MEVLGELPERMSVHLDGGYDSQTTREKLKSRGLEPMICEREGTLLRWGPQNVG